MHHENHFTGSNRPFCSYRPSMAQLIGGADRIQTRGPAPGGVPQASSLLIAWAPTTPKPLPLWI